MTPEGRWWRFRGHVQGVGFRWRARELARIHGLTGRVRNVSDGSVELLAEGFPDDLEAFAAALAEQMGDGISDMESSARPATGMYGDFSVAYE